MKPSTALLRLFPNCTADYGWPDEALDQLDRDCAGMRLTSEQIDATVANLLRQPRRGRVPTYPEVHKAFRTAAHARSDEPREVWEVEVPNQMHENEHRIVADLRATSPDRIREMLADTFAWICVGGPGRGWNVASTANFWHGGGEKRYQDIDLAGDLTVRLAGTDKKSRYFRWLMWRASWWAHEREQPKRTRAWMGGAA